ncbi:hypothetical protein [Oceanobacillus sp. FSL H7-0719]|uniref:hypothetical protein n=1 Tax=Oceanobacillus sp. FSL H7-0719 TaxID=2954507 RepID=UPI003245CAC0
MNAHCECEELTHIKVEADIGTEPLWCGKCGFNLDINGFELSDILRKELMDWANAYGTWIDWDTDGLIAGGEAIEMQHNALGLLLTEKIIKEWVEEYQVTFSPSHYRKKIESHT